MTKAQFLAKWVAAFSGFPCGSQIVAEMEADLTAMLSNMKTADAIINKLDRIATEFGEELVQEGYGLPVFDKHHEMRAAVISILNDTTSQP